MTGHWQSGWPLYGDPHSQHQLRQHISKPNSQSFTSPRALQAPGGLTFKHQPTCRPATESLAKGCIISRCGPQHATLTEDLDPCDLIPDLETAERSQETWSRRPPFARHRQCDLIHLTLYHTHASSTAPTGFQRFDIARCRIWRCCVVCCPKLRVTNAIRRGTVGGVFPAGCKRLGQVIGSKTNIVEDRSRRFPSVSRRG